MSFIFKVLLQDLNDLFKYETGFNNIENGQEKLFYKFYIQYKADRWPSAIVRL